MAAFFNMDMNDPQSMGLLATGLGILANNGQMPTGQVLAHGLLGGMGAVQQLAQNRREQEYQDARLRHLNAETSALENKQEQAEQQRQALQQFRQGMGNLGNVRAPFVGPYASPMYDQADSEAQTFAANQLRTEGLLGGIPIETMNAVLPKVDPKFETIYDESTGRERKAWVSPGAAPRLVGGVKTDLPWYVNPNGSINPAYPKAAGEEAEAKAAASFPYDIRKAREGRPSISVRVPIKVGETYGEKIAGGVADQDIQLRDAARSAVDSTRVRQEMLRMLDGGMITGTGANARLQIAKALKLAGYSNSEDIANTEAYSALAAQQTLAQIKASGLGAGNGFSNADRDFLEKAQGGNIALDATTLRRILQLQDKAARFTYDKWAKRKGQIEQSPIFNELPPGTFDVPEMPKPQVNAVPFRREMKARDLKRGQAYQLPDGSVRTWNGMQFK